MALIDNIADVAFASKYPIDKVIEESPNYFAVLPPGSASAPSNITASVTHTAGAQTVVEGRFSLDDVNFYPFGASIAGAMAGDYQQFVQLVAYNDDDTVHFLFVQGFETQQSVYFDFAMVSLA